MGIRDDELKRLEKYAQGLGVKVSYKKYIKYSMDAATWATDGSEISVFTRSEKSKTDLIMDLVHELGHHLSFIYNNKEVPKKLNIALTKEMIDINPTLDQRKAILDFELLGMMYHDTIIKEVDLKIPKWKFKLENEYQKYMYTYYWKHGNIPKNNDKWIKYQQLKAKYDPKRSNK